MHNFVVVASKEDGINYNGKQVWLISSTTEQQLAREKRGNKHDRSELVGRSHFDRNAAYRAQLGSTIRAGITRVLNPGFHFRMGVDMDDGNNQATFDEEAHLGQT